MILNVGPIDKVVYEWGDTFTMKQKSERDRMWRSSTDEAIQNGKILYDINAIGDVGLFFEEIKNGKYGTSEVDVYRTLTNGVADPRFNSLEHFS